MSDSATTLGIVGAGSIGRRIAEAVSRNEIPYHLCAICDIDANTAQRLCADFAPNIQPVELQSALSNCEVVVECAAAAAVPTIIETATQTHRLTQRPQHLLVMSVIGLLGTPFPHAEGPVIHVPAGALGGLDAVQAMAIAGLDEVTLTTRKPPAALGVKVTEETVLFDGEACDVVQNYPKNVNVAMALSLAGLGPHHTKVRLIADPSVKRNTHHVVARGPAGEIEFISRNLPFPDNPRTSYLAALSAVALLKRLAAKLQIG